VLEIIPDKTDDIEIPQDKAVFFEDEIEKALVSIRLAFLTAATRSSQERPLCQHKRRTLSDVLNGR